MKQKLYFLYSTLVGITIFLSSCKVRERIPAPSTPADSTTMDTVWRTQINDYSITPMLNSEGDVLSSKMFSSSGEVFQLFDGKTGKLKWEWKDYFSPESGFKGSNHVLYKDVLVLSRKNTSYAVDAITGKTIWRDYQNDLFGDNFLTGDEDGFIYHSFRPMNLDNRFVYIWRTRYDQLSWEQVCVFEEPMPLDRIRTGNMIIAKNKEGEKVLIYTLHIFREINGETKEMSRVIAYNLHTKKVIWNHDNSKQDINLTFWKTSMVSKGNTVFIFGVIGQEYVLNAYQVDTGKLLWSKSIPDFGLGLYLYKDLIIPLINRTRMVEALDINTGNAKWVQPFNDKPIYQINFDFDDSKVYKNFLISTVCDKLLALDLENGRVVYYEKPKVMYNCLQYGLAINEDKRWFYIQDRKFINCYKIPFQIK
jgi:outer membrane protein assembly factor BamB